MKPYSYAPAHIPRSSSAPIFADINASPDIQLAFERPARKKSLLVRTLFLKRKPMKITKAKYIMIIR